MSADKTELVKRRSCWRVTARVASAAAADVFVMTESTLATCARAQRSEPRRRHQAVKAEPRRSLHRSRSLLGEGCAGSGRRSNTRRKGRCCLALQQKHSLAHAPAFSACAGSTGRCIRGAPRGASPGERRGASDGLHDRAESGFQAGCWQRRRSRTSVAPDPPTAIRRPAENRGQCRARRP